MGAFYLVVTYSGNYLWIMLTTIVIYDSTVVIKEKSSIIQCEKIGWFLKALCNNCYFKISPNIWQLFGLFWSISRFNKKTILVSGHLLKKLGGLLIPTFGHTKLTRYISNHRPILQISFTIVNYNKSILFFY